MKKWIDNNILGILLCLIIAIIAQYLGKHFHIIGGPVFGLLIGMSISGFLKDSKKVSSGIKFVSKKVLQYAVILLGFGLNLNVILKTGEESLPIIVSTISIALIVAFVFYKANNISPKTATLIGVGSSICGGSAIAATAPVIDASEEEVAQSISVIFLFNIIGVLIFPPLANFLGFSQDANMFGIFAGSAINDTSSVTAAASIWDNMYNLGVQTLDTAVTVKLTRTLAIIPIVAILATKRHKNTSIYKSFPYFILFFIAASIITTITTNLGVDASIFNPLKGLSKFFIIMAMSAIGLNTHIIKLIKNGGKSILLGLLCSIAIIGTSLIFLL